jgi:hypothetical protein
MRNLNTIGAQGIENMLIIFTICDYGVEKRKIIVKLKIQIYINVKYYFIK